MPLATQSRLGPYEVISLVGVGAVGEVYRARDSRLHRDVAVKILGATNRSDDESIRRFETEARAASALNHPNIVTIHDVGREDDLSYIVTELVEGESLRNYLLQNSSLPMRTVLEIGLQICEGLAAAHDHGIIHRDLKPENIMVTAHGRVKILDFGLAKPAEEQGFSGNATLGANDTAPGVIFGTAAYMSPEQAKGGRIRFYSDQFALGVILYEMASGVHPFKRDTALQTLSAMLTEDPPPLLHGSPPFQWLVRRCLHREPDHRYASTHDISRELRNILDHLTDSMRAMALGDIAEPEQSIAKAPAVLDPRPIPQNSHRRLRTMLWLTAIVLAGAVGYVLSDWLNRQGELWAGARFVPLASTAALEVFPAWSPNSRSVAYSADVDGLFQILVRSDGASMPAQLTRSQMDCFFPFWSPDGVRIYFVSGQSLWSVSATGGTPEKVLENVVQAAIAPDGRQIAVLRSQQNLFGIWTGTIDAGSLTQYRKGGLAQLNILPWSYLRFAPDGKKLGAWLSLGEGRSEFWVIPMPEGEPKRELTHLESDPFAREFAWMQGGQEILFSEGAGSVARRLQRADLTLNRVMGLTNGPGSEFSPSVALDGRKVAFATTRLDYDIVRYRLDGESEDVLATPMFEAAPAISSLGHFTYVTDRSGHPEIWLRESGGSWERPLVTASSFGEDRPSFLFDPVFSPDGRRIAYSRANGQGESIWISTVNGDPPVRLAKERGGSIQRGPTWSPDGNSIAYFSLHNGSSVLLQTRVGARDEPIVMATNAGGYPRWSPRGEWIACIGNTEGLTLVSSDGKRRKDAGSGKWLAHGWSQDGSAVIGMRENRGEGSRGHRLEIVTVDAATGIERVTAELGRSPASHRYAMAIGSLPVQGFAITADGKSFLTSVIRPTSDVWMMDRAK